MTQPSVHPFDRAMRLVPNADGSLTADEYKAFVSKNYGDQQK